MTILYLPELVKFVVFIGLLEVEYIAEGLGFEVDKPREAQHEEVFKVPARVEDSPTVWDDGEELAGSFKDLNLCQKATFEIDPFS